MKSFEFGKKIYELRKSYKISQQELANELNISNKAISKWENGESLPSIAQLIKLSEIFNTSLDSLLKHEQKTDKQIYKIVITGGPCSGKSTAMSWIQNEFSKKGYMVLFVPETASELILGGISASTIDKNLNYENYILKLQLEKEKIFEQAATHILNYDKVIIIYDRGTLDCKAYMNRMDFKQCLQALNMNEIKLRDHYDAVIHLITAAKGAPESYNYNNPARRETLEEAIKLDEKTLNSWIGHPHLRIIDNSTNFEMKMKRLISEIYDIIGDPTPYEIERKYLIEHPNLAQLEKLESCTKVEIIQTYLKSDPENEIRIRQRGENGYFTYTKTCKTKVSEFKRTEIEQRLTQSEYLNLMLEADTSKAQIRKTRYLLNYKNQYFEIDIYPFWKDKAILEIELSNEKEKVELPKFIKVIKEVTGDDEFFNSNIAKTIKK